MKTHLYMLFAGSAFYNVFMAFTKEHNERYVYAAGVIISILIVGKIMDSLDKAKDNAGQ